MKKNILLCCVLSFVTAVLILSSLALNTVALKNNYLLTTANNNAITASGIVNELQYSLRYGKSLNNYYGIEDILQKAKNYCEYLENVYIADGGGKLLYDMNFGESDTVPAADDIYALKNSGKTYALWTDGDTQHILLSVFGKNGEITAFMGLNYSNRSLDGEVGGIANRLIKVTFMPVLFGILLFIVLFFTVKHGYKFKRLLAVAIPVIIVSSAVCGILSYVEYKVAYTGLVNKTAGTIFLRIENDIRSVTGKGVDLDQVVGLDGYFEDILKHTELVENIAISDKADTAGDENALYYETEGGQSVRFGISEKYIAGKLREITTDILASIVTSILISAEVIIFILALMSGFKMLRAKSKTSLREAGDADVLPVGVVRGLSFFFAMFQYMPIAFVPIVMAHIYKPVFGLPYEIMISIPITAQIFMSIFSSWVCGAVVARKGWRPVAFFGIAFMIVGAVVAAFSAEPLLFIFSQLIFGFGLGCAKTAFDIFSVISASSENIEAYTSNSNAGIITGLSCSAALGAAIAGVAGYFGAFITMALFGLALLLLIRIFAVNIVQRPHPEEKTVTDNASVPRFDKKFAYYILLLIIPYSFVSMYLDYFFPVYADANGMSTGNIGHVFLLYGIATAYVGTFICNRFSKSVKTALFMASLLLIAGCVMGVFSVYANLALAVAFVLLMGITDGIMPSLQYRYVFSLDISKRYGISRVIGMEGTFAGIIRGVSPFIFSLVMIYGETGLLISSVAVMAAAVILFALNVKKGDALNG